MSEEILLDAEERMDKAVEAYGHTLDTVRTGRASTALVEHLHVSHYGQSMPLNQLATLAAPEAQLITIQPWDKGTFDSIMKAIQTSDLGINPNNDGAVIRVNLPQLTEERRKEYIKVAKHKAEDARVSIRNVRRHAKDALDKMVKDGEAGEDDVRRAEKHLDEATHKHVEHIDEILKHKEAELLEV